MRIIEAYCNWLERKGIVEIRLGLLIPESRGQRTELSGREVSDEVLISEWSIAIHDVIEFCAGMECCHSGEVEELGVGSGNFC